MIENETVPTIHIEYSQPSNQLNTQPTISPVGLLLSIICFIAIVSIILAHIFFKHRGSKMEKPKENFVPILGKIEDIQLHNYGSRGKRVLMLDIAILKPIDRKEYQTFGLFTIVIDSYHYKTIDYPGRMAIIWVNPANKKDYFIEGKGEKIFHPDWQNFFNPFSLCDSRGNMDEKEYIKGLKAIAKE